MTEPHSERDLNVDVRARWDANAEFWDHRMGEGNLFHTLLVAPSVLALLELTAGERVLEIACGNGQFARQLTALGAHVTATDFSPAMLERARAHREPFNDQIAYRLLDATNERDLKALGEHAFDAVVCNMALMDMAEIDPLFRALSHILTAHGRFVFAIMHPCFNSNNPVFVAEYVDRGGGPMEERALKLTYYLGSRTYYGLAMEGQPAVQYYFHRSLQELLGTAFRAGLSMDGLLEPVFAPDESGSQWRSWGKYREFPPVLAARLRVAFDGSRAAT